MATPPKAKGFQSTKDSGGIQRGRVGVSKSENLGKLMRKHRDLEDVLYPYVSNSDMVYEDMDFSIEEFADMTGAKLDELLAEINKAIK